MYFSDFRCVRCNASQLAPRDAAPAEGPVARGAIVCGACGAAYDLLWGMPFFGDYETHDLLGLLEIAAGAGLTYQESGEAFVAYQDHLFDYHTAADRGSLDAPQIHRYTEWFILETLIHGLELDGKDVLDVGAGRGYDSAKLAHAGARVTALEYSPVLMRQGKANLPQARWVGGFSHLLPFVDGSFDYIFCNAALHHMRDIPISVEEMLRVLRPGGFLLTISDAYGPIGDTQSYEMAYLGDHPDVLGGVNERLPSFGEFVGALQRHRQCVEPEVFAFIKNAPEGLFPGFKGDYGCYLRRWDFDRHAASLARTHGVVNMRVELQKPLGIPAKLQKEPGLISAGEYSQWLDDSSRAIAGLASVLPPDNQNIPFPGLYNKFFMLNGWLMRQHPSGQRQMYRRGRWFFGPGEEQTHLHLEVAAPYLGWDNAATLEVAANAQVLLRRPLARGMWHRVSIPLAEAVSGPLCLEVRVITHSQEWENNLLTVRRLELGAAESPAPPNDEDVFAPNLEAWCDLLKPGPGSRLRVLFWPSPELTARVLNLLRARGLEVDAVAAQGQEDYLAWQPGVRLAETYPDPNLDGFAGAPALGDIDLIAAPDASDALGLAGMIDAKQQVAVVFYDGRVVATDQLAALKNKGAVVRAVMASGRLKALARRLPQSWQNRLRKVADRMRQMSSS